MKLYVTAVHDRLNGYGQLVTVNNLEVAKRSFVDTVNDVTTTVAKNVYDFTLWCLGTYDVDTGALVPKLECILKADSIKG